MPRNLTAIALALSTLLAAPAMAQAMLLIFATPDGATWTAVMLRHDGVGSMAAAGSDWQARSDPVPVPEEGL
jgi:hypothetical protein